MRETVNRCIALIKEKSKIQGNAGYDTQAPKNPSIIINYNLDEKMVKDYLNYLEQLWPGIYRNVPRAGKDSNFETIENSVRGNPIFENYNLIYIQILVNLTNCSIQELREFCNKYFSQSRYEIILHEFLDYEKGAEIDSTEEKLLNMMRSDSEADLQLIYSNRLFNGGMWIGENARKLLRLSADMTAVMCIDSRYFGDGKVYTFSYNLLEKPTRKIVQFTIYRLLENMCSYDAEDDRTVAKRIKKFQTVIEREAGYRISGKEFREYDFKYLPSNQKLQKEKVNINKSISALERNYPVAASCYHEMIRRKIEEAEKINLNNLDFNQEIGSELTYFDVNSYLKNNHSKEDIIKEFEGELIRKTPDPSVGTYGKYEKVLADYANQLTQYTIIQQIMQVFREQFSQRIDRACQIDEWIRKFMADGELQINSVENEKNLTDYYGKLVDDFWLSNREIIIKRLDSCVTQEDFLKKGLLPTLRQLFENTAVYYKSFEDEIDERIGKDTAKDMFRKISEEDKVEKNICIDMTNLQFSMNLLKTNKVILLINPESELLKVEVKDKYDILKLSRQDCIERIDFHTLSWKEGETNGN